jgi:hypothetical protein
MPMIQHVDFLGLDLPVRADGRQRDDIEPQAADRRGGAVVKARPALPNRKPPEFRCCPVCEVEFWLRHPDQRWCSVDCSNIAKRGVNTMFREVRRQMTDKS